MRRREGEGPKRDVSGQKRNASGKFVKGKVVFETVEAGQGLIERWARGGDAQDNAGAVDVPVENVPVEENLPAAPAVILDVVHAAPGPAHDAAAA